MAVSEKYQMFSIQDRATGRPLTEQEVRLMYMRIHGRAPDRAYKTGGGWLAGPITPNTRRHDDESDL